ncbi:hypothetical protein AAF712_001384, partial [Marasmius tenuissimus]
AGSADSNDTVTGSSFSPSGACFTDRKSAAVRAYHEWMPIRQVDAEDQLRIWRNFQEGLLLDLTMLDTRQYDRDLTDVYYNTGPNDSTTYNPVTGEGAIGVEFAGTAVTSSSSFGKIPPAAADVISRDLVDGDTNLNLQWSAGFYRGFFTLTIDTESIKATYYAMRNISYPNLDAFVSAHFVVQAGANKLQRPVAGGEENVKAGTLKINGTKSNQMRTDTKSSRW